MKAKLVKESLNNIEYLIFLFRDMFDGDYSPEDAAQFVNDNWEDMTGGTEDDKHEEQEFPSEVVEFLDEIDIEYDEFCDEWTSLHG